MGARNPNYVPGRNLGYLADNGYELAVHCPGCDRKARVAIHPLARRLGPYRTIDVAALKLKCGRCGRKGVDVKKVKWDQDIDLPHWPSR